LHWHQSLYYTISACSNKSGMCRPGPRSDRPINLTAADPVHQAVSQRTHTPSLHHDLKQNKKPTHTIPQTNPLTSDSIGPGTRNEHPHFCVAPTCTTTTTTRRACLVSQLATFELSTGEPDNEALSPSTCLVRTPLARDLHPSTHTHPQHWLSWSPPTQDQLPPQPQQRS
jgi:hypothetical protein